MPKFRKKPVVIEAEKWTGLCTPALTELACADSQKASQLSVDGRIAVIKTLEGTMRAEIGDWIIRGVKGELYPCKPEIFEATYDAV